MCDFCDNIKDSKWIKETSPYDRYNCIVQTEEKTFGLWVECEDYYYSGIAMQINFCPKCGFNLIQADLLRKARAKSPHAQKYGFDF